MFCPTITPSPSIRTLCKFDFFILYLDVFLSNSPNPMYKIITNTHFWFDQFNYLQDPIGIEIIKSVEFFQQAKSLAQWLVLNGVTPNNSSRSELSRTIIFT